MIKDLVRQRRQADAAQAWSLARAAGDAGDLIKARFWFERAKRLAPEDPRPALELAMLLASRHDSRVVASLADIAARYDIASAWTGLAFLYYRHGRVDEAAAALGRVLSRTEIPDTHEFAEFAGLVARGAGYAGWSGIGPGFKLRIDSTFPLSAVLDDEPFRLPRSAILPVAGKRLDVAANGSALLGSPIDLARIGRTDGIVAVVDDGLAGWAVRPASPETRPTLYLTDAAGKRRKILADARLEPAAEAPFSPRHAFSVARSALARLAPPFIISGADGKPLYGSPINPALDLKPVPAEFAGASPAEIPDPAPLAVIIPAYRNAGFTEATLDSLFKAIPDKTLILVVDDAGPEPELRALLGRHARQGRIRLVRHRVNRGFPAAANSGIRAARKHLGQCDILLLNADTLMPPGAAARLHEALYARPDIGSVTPLSNEATIASYPKQGGGNPAPDLADTIALDQMAARSNRGRLTEIPTAIGFCMAIRHDCLKQTGPFREDVFAQGYGEENDWCLRARHKGWRHFALPSCFVAHRGGASFGAAGQALASRNIGLLNQIHPGYDQLIAAHAKADPLFTARRRLDEARFKAGRKQAAAALISHDHGGGIARVVETRMAALRRRGIRPVLLQPDFSGGGVFEDGIGRTRLTDGAPDAYPNLLFELPREFPMLLRLLLGESVRAVEFHHGLGHHPLVRTLGAALNVPADHVVHDYASFCKRVNLMGAGRRYCGEPAVRSCLACVEQEGSELTDPIDPVALRMRSSAEFRAARRVTVPSADAAKRLARHFPGIKATITPWEDDEAAFALAPPPSPPAPRLIAVIGGIGPAKGYDVLMGCARDAAERCLDLRFVIIGVSEHDAPLIDTGRVDITGPYQEGEAAALVRMQRADLAFLPSIWPETWCFALTEAWRGGLYTIGFDLGAQAERIRATRRGDVLPLGLPPARINDFLLAWQPNFGNFNLQMHAARAVQPVHA